MGSKGVRQLGGGGVESERMVTALYVGHWEEGTGVSFSNPSLVIPQQCSGGSD